MRKGILRAWTLLLVVLFAVVLVSCTDPEPDPEPTTYTVTFDADNGTTPTTVTVEEGQTVSEPTAPTKTGYTFNGWYLGNTLYVFATPVTQNITLVAHWTEVVVEPTTYEVTFNTLGGGTIPKQTVESGNKATQPGAPIKENFVFDGWLKDGVEFDFNSVITSDVNLVAKYTYIGIPDSPTYNGRAFNADFDQKLDGEEIKNNASKDAEAPYIQAWYSGSIGNNPNGALWKQAGPANGTAAAFQYLVLRLRGSHGASIHDLSIAFRYDDNHELIVVPLAETLDPDLEPNTRELTSEWHNYVISIPDTLDGKVYEGMTGYTDVDAGGIMVGFHLMNTSVYGSGLVEIKDAYYSKLPNPVYPYEGSNYAQNKEYWFGTVGYEISDYMIVNPSGSYGQYLTEGANELNTHVVIRMRQESAGEINLAEVKIAPVFADGSVGDYVAFADIDSMPTFGSGWLNYTIPFAEIYDGELLVTGYKLLNESDSKIAIRDAFLSYLGDYQAAEYPLLDFQNVLMYDNFNRETIGATPDWTPDNPVAIANGFTYIISYGGLHASTIGDGYITFDSTGGGYASYKVFSTTKMNYNEYRYLVFKYRLNDEGTLNDFRLTQLNHNDAPVGGVVYANQMVAGLGLPSVPEDLSSYPYRDGDWVYLIVDLVLTEGLSTDFGGLEIYYTGSSLSIDAMFFANVVTEIDPSTETAVADFESGTLLNDSQYEANDWGTGTEVVDLEGVKVLHMPNNGDNWTQYWANYKEYGRFMKLDIMVPADSSFENFRLGDHTNKFVGANSGQIILANGLPLFVPADGLFHTVIIDLVASGFDLSPYWILGNHGSELFFDSISFFGAIPNYVDEFVFATFESGELGIADETQWWQASEATPNISVVEIGGTYALKLNGVEFVQYATGIKGTGHYLAFDILLEEGSSLQNLRFQSNVDTEHVKWVKDGAILLADGTPLAVDAIPADGQWHHIMIQWTGSGLALTDTVRIALDGGDVIYLDNLAWWNDRPETLYPHMEFDFTEGILDEDPNFYWHNGDPVDGVISLVTDGYVGFAFGSPVVGHTAWIKVDAKLSASGNADTFRVELGGGNVVNWSTMIDDGYVTALTEEFQTFMIPVSAYVANISTFDTLGFHINNGGVILDNLVLLYDSYSYQVANFNDSI
jgi:uncharacterized repeat protein (TIGR02543 family)